MSNITDNPKIQVLKAGGSGVFTNYIYKAIPLAFDESMSYYETLAGLRDYLEETVIPTVNNNAEAVAELQSLYEELNKYVDDYFKNLDVQEEINNKLDEMVENGTLVNILLPYLEKKPYYFNTVAEMKSYDLKVGDMAITLGYYEANDGGAGQYEIVDDDTLIDDGGSVIELGNGLRAKLIIDNNVNVKQFGAYGDDIHDDTQAIINMMTYAKKIKIGAGTYKVANSITITENIPIEMDNKSRINYTGNDYCFIIKNMSGMLLKFGYFYSTTGGMINIIPDNNQAVTFTNIFIRYCYCELNAINMDATNGIITTIIIDGIRVRGNSHCINMNIGANAITGTYLTEINIKNIDIWSPNKGILATCLNNNCEIQFNLYECDIENCTGIETNGRITALGIYNCRTFEIVSKTGWLTFTDYLPTISLQGNGDLYPNRFTLNNISASNKYFMITNMRVYDSLATYYYEGGAILYPTYFVPLKEKTPSKIITNDDLVDSNYEYDPQLTGGIYKYFLIQTDVATKLTIPRNQLTNEFYIRVYNNISLTIYNGSNNLYISEAGYYKIEQLGNRCFYTKMAS